MGAGSDQTEAQRLISSLVFENSKSIRTSTIILASFNGLAAFATAFSILYDCYCTSKRYGNTSNSKYGFLETLSSYLAYVYHRKVFLWAMHPAETFPLVLALGIVVQGVIFAVAQSFGLESLMIDSCSTIAQFVFPGKLPIGYRETAADSHSNIFALIYSYSFWCRVRNTIVTKRAF